MGSAQAHAASARGEGPSVIVSRNPATGEILGEVSVMGPVEVRDAVQRAREAQAAWGKLAACERARRLLAFRDEILKRTNEVAELLSKEGGKTKLEAVSMEILLVADLTTYFAKRAEKILAPKRIPLHLLKHKKSYLHYTPRGVIGIIAPWNFPLSIPMGDTVMALIAGNAVVLKPSEVTPLIALKMKELFDACGMPKDLLQVVTGRGETGAALIDAGVDKIVFTGSVVTGRKVAAACGERLIPYTLELGGKAPAIVCADADLERTANALVWGAFGNSGQVCCSVERVYAHETIYDELVQKVVAKTRSLRQGNPLSFDTDVGAMAWDRQVSIVEDRIRTAVSAGARALAGGSRMEGPGLFFPPTVLVDVRQDMDVMRQEIFGPVMPIMKVRSEEDAIRLANDSHLGLVGYVFTKDRTKGARIAERVECGTVMINDVLFSFGVPETPWIGIKQSGLGFTHSDDGLREMCLKRHVNVDRFSTARELWWYPYSEKTYKIVTSAMGFLFRPRKHA
ncbi:MAG: aldehyde dehydrogenase family protein [Deltaproteobacteria bacterium]|nr:aldehyde dehydrogenase family protein [Deltaproteobacteria bacterium]